MSLKKKSLTVVVSAALLVGTVTTVNVASASAAPAIVAHTPGTHTPALEYDTRAVISYFILGTGPLIQSHQDLSDALGIVPQEVPDDVIDELVSQFEAVDAELMTRVVEPIQSGDPARAQAALEALSADVALVAERLQSQAGDPAAAQRATARGWTYTINWVATVQAAAAGAYVLAAAAVVVLAIVLYSPADSATEFDRELAAKAVAQGL
jgi:SdpC family antimicrobial peptide